MNYHIMHVTNLKEMSSVKIKNEIPKSLNSAIIYIVKILSFVNIKTHWSYDCNYLLKNILAKPLKLNKF